MHAAQGRNESGDADPNFNQYLDYNSSSEIGTDPRLAIFNFQPRKTINAQLDLCLVRNTHCMSPLVPLCMHART